MPDNHPRARGRRRLQIYGTAGDLGGDSSAWPIERCLEMAYADALARRENLLSIIRGVN